MRLAQRLMIRVLLLGGMFTSVACNGKGDALGDPGEARDAGPDGSVAIGNVDDAAATPDTSPMADDSAAMQSDPHHCGAYAHDCLGGECIAGICQPVTLATVALPGVSSFAIDGQSIYWSTSYMYDDAGTTSSNPMNGVISKCPKAGCTGAPTTLATGQNFPEGLSLVGQSLYWTNENGASFVHCGIDCDDDAATFYKWGSPSIGPIAFAANSTQAFFSTPSGSQIETCPTSQCVTPVTFASGQEYPREIVVTDGGIYWVNLGQQVIAGDATIRYQDGGIMACPGGGACDAGPFALATGLAYPQSLVVQGTTAYWAQGNAVVACDVSGCGGRPKTVVSLASPDGVVEGIALDATDVYFVAASDGAPWKIGKCPLTGCFAGTTLYINGASIQGLVMDATRLYFASTAPSAIFALAK